VGVHAGAIRAPLVQAGANTELALRRPQAVPSMALRTLVVENDWPTRNYLVKRIESSALAEVVGAVGSAEEAWQAIRSAAAAGGGGRIDVALVDASLEGGAADESGLTLVRSLAADPEAPMFVLAAASDKHALEAFDLGVVDYLLKPVNEERIAQTLRRLQRRRSTGRRPLHASARIVAYRKRSLIFLDPSEVWAFEAWDRSTFVHTTQGKLDVNLALAAIESSLGHTFMRVHRNWLVNFVHVRGLERADDNTKLFVGAGVADGGIGLCVPVGRERAAAIRKILLMNTTDLRLR
jgi:DNA-binding LytR/AlgR family response regulator